MNAIDDNIRQETIRAPFFRNQDNKGLSYKSAQKFLNGRKISTRPFAWPKFDMLASDWFLLILSIHLSMAFDLVFDNFRQPFQAEKLPYCETINDNSRNGGCLGPTRDRGFAFGYTALTILFFGAIYGIYAGYQKRLNSTQNASIVVTNTKIDLLKIELMPLGTLEQTMLPQEAVKLFPFLESDSKLVTKFNFPQLEACRKAHPALFKKCLKNNTLPTILQLDWRLLGRIEIAKGQEDLQEIFQWQENLEPFGRNPKLLELTIKAIGQNSMKELNKFFYKTLQNDLLSDEAAALLSKKQCKQIISLVAGSSLTLEEAIEKKLYSQVDFWFGGYLFSIPSYLSSHLSKLLAAADQAGVERLNKSQLEQYIFFLKDGQAPFEQWFDLLMIACILEDTPSKLRLEKALTYQLERVLQFYDVGSLLAALNDFSLPTLKNQIDQHLSANLKQAPSQSELISSLNLAKDYHLPLYLAAILLGLKEMIEHLAEEETAEDFFELLDTYFNTIQATEDEESLEAILDEQLAQWLKLHPHKIDQLYCLADENDAAWLKGKLRQLLKENLELLNFSAMPDDLVGVMIFP